MKKICISKEWTFSGPEFTPSVVDLPHDYSIKLPRDPKSPGGGSNGYFTGTRGSYEKYLHLNYAHAILDVDGAYMCARVMLNEEQLDFHPHGYTPFLVDLTPRMRRESINKLQITVQNLQPSTRWYSGSGLYRDVFLWTGGEVRIEPWDLFVTTQSADRETAQVELRAQITADLEMPVTLRAVLRSRDGAQKAGGSQSLTAKPGKTDAALTLTVTEPHLWDTEDPYLYDLQVLVEADGQCLDETVRKFGIRTISFDMEHGFRLNGVTRKLRGGCIHHDHAGLGAASFPAAERRKLSKLKSVGFNAIRAAHNPPSLAQLETCDELGILVMDEAFDMWNIPESNLDYSLWFADWWARDIRAMVLRDRNHPCVISYSIGNEIVERDGRSDGPTWSRKLRDEIRKYDTTRPVTTGICGMWYKPDENAPQEYKDLYLKGFADSGEGTVDSSWATRTEAFLEPMDIVGYNYMYPRYAHDRKLYPNRIIWGSESHTIHFYQGWKAVMENSHVLGDFTWTAYDNLGEAGTGRFAWARDGIIPGISIAEYPWRSCFQGDFDLAGFRRPQSYFRESIWRENCAPRIFTTHPEHYGEGFTGTEWHWYDVSSTWNFEDAYLGKPVRAEVYTDADFVAFSLNGRKIAQAAPFEGIAAADIPYERGELKAESYKAGEKVGEFTLHTLGAPVKLQVEAERAEIAADNRDLCYFPIRILDEAGDVIPNGANELVCTCRGGELMAVFSGDPKNEDQYTSNRCHAFCGTAVAVVRTKTPGTVLLTVESKGLLPDQATVKAI